MKPILSILLIFVGLNTNAQKIRYTDHRNQWVSYGAGITICPFNRILHYGTDTTISGIAYHHLVEQINMLSTAGCLPSTGSQDYVVREDTTAGIIYYRELIPFTTTDTNEHVYFDYNLHTGDTIRFLGNTVRDTVLLVDSTLINGVYHKVFVMGSNGTMSMYTFVEGVGCMKYPYVTFMDGCFSAHEQLICFSQDGVNTDMNFMVYQCYNTPTSFNNISSCTALSVPEIQTTHADITIAPNPAYDHVDITTNHTFAASTVIRIYDITGKCVFKTQTDNTKSMQTINTSSWPDGLYMVIIQDNSGIVKKEKVVVQH